MKFVFKLKRDLKGISFCINDLNWKDTKESLWKIGKLCELCEVNLLFKRFVNGYWCNHLKENFWVISCDLTEIPYPYVFKYCAHYSV